MAIGWQMNAAVFGVSLMAMSEVPNFLAGALPSFMTIKKFAADPESIATLRYAEAFAALPIAAAGLGATLVFRSMWPLVIVTATAAYYYYGYEKHIRNPSPTATPIDQQGGGQAGYQW